MPGESITALTVWDPFEKGPSPDAARGAAPEGAGTPAAVQRGGLSDEEGGSSAQLRSHPIAFSPESPAAAAAAAAAAEAVSALHSIAAEGRPWGGFIVVGTSIDHTGCVDQAGGTGKEWDDESSTALQGRLLLLQLTAPTAASSGASRAAAAAGEGAPPPWEQPPRRRLQLLPVSQLHLPSRVLALCTGPASLRGLTSSGGGSSDDGSGSGSGRASTRLFASVGRRLVAYEWSVREQLLHRVSWIPTNRPLASLQVRLVSRRRCSGKPWCLQAQGCSGAV